MKHHFGDFLDRTGDYWAIVPNRDRYAYTADYVIEDKEMVKILTISKYHEDWRQVFDCPNIEELTLHDPSKEQVQSISALIQLKRLRITFFRATDIEFISDLINLEELVLEYVSGFSDLTPLSKLPKLKSIHFENLRRVSNFDGLRGLNSLRYLHIDGTLDWNQPIENFNFLEGLPYLEVFSLGWIINHSVYPAFAPILSLKKLKKINVIRNTFPSEEFAFLEVALPNVEGASWDLCREYEGWIDFVGKRSGRVKCNNPDVKNKCEEYIRKYEEMKLKAEEFIKLH